MWPRKPEISISGTVTCRIEISNATHVTVAWSVRLSGGMSSVTLVHPDKTVGRNEMPFGSGTQVVPNNIVLDRGRGPGPSAERGNMGIGTPVRIDAACTVDKLLLHLLLPRLQLPMP